jgi:hypothetical protein
MEMGWRRQRLPERAGRSAFLRSFVANRGIFEIAPNG